MQPSATVPKRHRTDVDDQWFVDTAKIVEPALDAVRTGRTTIIPDSDRKV